MIKCLCIAEHEVWALLIGILHWRVHSKSETTLSKYDGRILHNFRNFLKNTTYLSLYAFYVVLDSYLSPLKSAINFLDLFDLKNHPNK